MDIIICYGNDGDLYPPYPLLWGTRNKELSKVYRYKRHYAIDFIDLDWNEDDPNKYIQQVAELSIRKKGPLKYVVLPDLFTTDGLDHNLRVWNLMRQTGFFETAILPIKIPLDYDLPSWVRPGLPTLTEYELERDGTIDLSFFRNYTGAIHILGGPNIYTIMKHAQDYAPNSTVASFDFNSICKVIYFGKAIHPNGKNWTYYHGSEVKYNFRCSVKRLIDLYHKINDNLNDPTPGEVLEHLYPTEYYNDLGNWF